MRSWPHGFGFCHCGCGERTNIARQNRPQWGHVVGQPLRYLRGHHLRGNLRRLDKNGYVQLWMPDHPRGRSNGYVYEHLVVAEGALGRPVPIEHPVHHANKDKADNRPANLVICEDQAYHLLLHQRMRALEECGHADWLRCAICQEYAPPKSMYVNPQGHGRHRECHARYEAERRAAA